MEWFVLRMSFGIGEQFLRGMMGMSYSKINIVELMKYRGKKIMIDKIREKHPYATNLIIRHDFKMTRSMLKGYVFPNKVIGFHIGDVRSNVVSTKRK